MMTEEEKLLARRASKKRYADKNIEKERARSRAKQQRRRDDYTPEEKAQVAAEQKKYNEDRKAAGYVRPKEARKPSTPESRAKAAEWTRKWRAANPDKIKKTEYTPERAEYQKKWFDSKGEAYHLARNERARLKAAENRAKETPEDKAKKAEYMREYAKANKVELAARQKEWAAENADHKKEYAFNYARDNSAACVARAKAWVLANPERANHSKALWVSLNLDKIRGYYAKRYALHRDEILATQAAWHAENPGKSAIYAKTWKALNRKEYLAAAREYSHRRRALITNTPSDPETMAFCLAAQYMTSYTCCLCNEPKEGVPTIEHIIPVTRDGPHKLWNLGYACLPCNQEKTDKLIEEYYEWKIRKEAKISERAEKRIPQCVAV